VTATETTHVVDSSALIAFLRREPGAEVVRAILRSGALMSAINVSEVLATLATPENAADAVFHDLNTRLFGDSLRIVPFDAALALATARLRPLTRSRGLSLGDRACLALAQLSQGFALTADRHWADVAEAVGVTVRVIRP
jgi:PIN domain nuclease of toxin-antitoxin system